MTAPGEDRPALDELLRRGYRFALSLCHDPARAEDLLQDAWVSVLRAKGPWTQPYLFTAIRTRFVDGVRHDRSAPVLPLGERAEIEASGGDGFWSECSISPVMNGKLETALGQLRPRERAVLVLSVLEGYTAREIGDLLGMPRGTALSLMHRARRKLRRWLQDVEKEL